MKRIFVRFSLATLFVYVILYPCYIMKQENIRVGSYQGIQGSCSNNGLPISCILMEGVGVECDGPSGGYTGYDLDYLIFAACGCSVQEEEERRLQREFEGSSARRDRGRKS